MLSSFIAYSMLLHAIPEDTTYRACIDLDIKIPKKNYLLFELKVQKNATAQSALEQIKQMNYPEKYATHGLPIYIIGLIFNEDTRNVDDFAFEEWTAERKK